MGRGARPTTPAYLALACCAGAAAALLTQWHVSLAPLVWVLLGVTAGYSISGSP